MCVPVDDDETRRLFSLLDDGLVEHVGCEGSQHFRLSKKGLSALRIEKPMACGHAVFQVRKDIPLEDLSVFEKLLILQERGFVWLPLPKDRAARLKLLMPELMWGGGGGVRNLL